MDGMTSISSVYTTKHSATGVPRRIALCCTLSRLCRSVLHVSLFTSVTQGDGQLFCALDAFSRWIHATSDEGEREREK